MYLFVSAPLPWVSKLTEGRFVNQLANADELSRAVADPAAAWARLDSLRGALFAQKAKILLMAGPESFKKALALP